MHITSVQILINSLVSGLLLSLVAIGFAYVLRVARVFHIAHGGVYVAGAFAAWWALNQTGNWWITMLLAATVVIVLSYLIERLVYLPLSKRSSDQSISLVASMGVYVVITNSLAVLFGNDVKNFGTTLTGSVQLIGTTLTYVQVIQFAGALFAVVMAAVYFGSSRRALPLRAMADNELAAKVFGINTHKQRMRVFTIGSLLTAVAAILRTLDVGVDPQAGMNITLAAAVVTILVSRISVPLIILFSFFLTLLQNTVEFYSNAQWRDGVTFTLLLMVILFRTEGIISYNLRRDTV